MKLQFFVLGFFAAIALAKNEGGAESKNYDHNKCQVLGCGTSCPSGRVLSVEGETMVNGVCKVKCCVSTTGANDEPDENESEGKEREKRRGEASVLNKRLSRNSKKRLSSIDY
ncbi:hypothetical protein BJ944DRAFT_291593 [Cunninghamella echinulata]|nr:hypothetical protein BJ944DRAFT_291593 [Cunninghamella echinulata]